VPTRSEVAVQSGTEMDERTSVSTPASSKRLATVDAVAGLDSKNASAVRTRFVYPVVVDASAVIADLLYRLPLGNPERPSSIVRAAEAGSARLFAKKDAVQEILARVPTVAAEEGRDEARMCQLVAQEYVPWLRLVDLTGVDVDDPRVRNVAARDISDEDTAKLAVLLAPSLLLTTDRDLLDNGLGLFYEPGFSEPSWTFAAATLRDYGFRIELTAGTQGGALLLLLGANGAFNLGKALRRNPKVALLVGAAAVAGAWWLSSAGRLTKLSERMGDVSKVLGEGMEQIGARAITADAAGRQLIENAVTNAQPPTPLAAVARVLSLAPIHPGLTMTEIRQLVAPGLDVGVALENTPFVKVSRWRWTLGMPAS